MDRIKQLLAAIRSYKLGFHIREVMTGEENVHVGIVGTDSNDLERIGKELDELGLEVKDEDLMEGAARSTMDELAAATAEADKVLVF